MNWCEAGVNYYCDGQSMFGDVFGYGGMQQPYYWTNDDARTGNPCAKTRGAASAVENEPLLGDVKFCGGTSPDFNWL